MIGLTISHYRITTELGHGGMGRVYRAQDVRLDRSVALKFLISNSDDDPGMIERFFREARAASALNHPNIVTVHDIGETAQGRYLVMELVEGRTLSAMSHESIPIESVMDIGRQVAKALAAAHASNIVHRDVKPENIMVRPDGYVKVLDFGVARRLPASLTDSENRTTTVSSPGALVGTYRYMSPEQARGEPVSGSSDIFSLGIVLFELATGRHPFASDSAIDVLHRILWETPVPAAALNPSIPVELESLLLRMLEKNPQLRPSSDEVDQILSGLMEAKGIASVHSVARALELHRPNIVGRQKELQELHAALDSAKSGRGLMLCVAGEAGMGKTTLVDEFIHEIGTTTGFWSIARGRCSERLAGAEGYLPFLEALDNLVRNDPGQTLAHLMRTTAPGWFSQVGTASSRDTPSGGLVPETAAAAQQRMKRELGVFFEEATRLRPMLLYLDDLHWADLSTVDLLAYLGPKLPSMRLLLVGAYRPAELLLRKHPFLPVRQELQAHGTCREVALDFLTLEDVERYLSLEFPNHSFPPELPAVVHARTEGNALFMVNLIRYLSDNHVIGRQGDQPTDRWTLLQPLAEIERDMPESVRSMIQRKIDRLDPVDRRLLAAAALQGLEFDSAVLSKALGMSAVEVEDRLEAIESGHAIIRRLGESEHPDRTLTLRCGFVYGVYQDALHDLLTPARRAMVSAGVAQALEQFYGAQKTEIAAQLALLLETAREFSRASEYFLLAAQHALRVCANQEAAAMARRGVEAIRTAPASPERSKHELRLQTALAMSAMAISYSNDEVASALSRSRELCQELGDNNKLLGVLGGLHGYYSVRAQHRTALELSEQMLQLAEQVQEPRRLAQAHYVVGSSLLDTGNPLRALEHFKHGIALAQSNPARAEPVHNPAITCRCYAARSLIFLGRSDESFQMIQEALEISKKMRHPINYTFALMIASFLHQHHRDWRKAEEHATAMTVLARENGFQYLTAFGFILEGWALSEQGSIEEGATRLRNGINAFEVLGAEVGRPHYRALLAETLGRLGKVDEGLATIQESLAGVERTGERYYEAEIHRVQGQLLARSNDPGAEASLRRAVEVASSQSARAFELRAAIRLAAFLSDRNRKAEARQVLAPIYDHFMGVPETPDLRDARILLNEIG